LTGSIAFSVSGLRPIGAYAPRDETEKWHPRFQREKSQRSRLYYCRTIM